MSPFLWFYIFPAIFLFSYIKYMVQIRVFGKTQRWLKSRGRSDLPKSRGEGWYIIGLPCQRWWRRRCGLASQAPPRPGGIWGSRCVRVKLRPCVGPFEWSSRRRILSLISNVLILRSRLLLNCLDYGRH